jgi:hypothetical protein
MGVKTMKKIVSRLVDANTVFLGNTDSFTIINSNLRTEQIIGDINYSILLYDHAILPAAFLWQSSELRKLIPYLEPYIERGYILPAIRDYETTTDILDYYNRRIDETYKNKDDKINSFKSIASEIALPEHLKIARDIGRIGTQLHSDISSVRTEFQREWRKDLINKLDSYSLYSIVDSNSLLSDKEEFLKKLERLSWDSSFSRSYIVGKLLEANVKERLMNLLVARVSLLFLRANANLSKSDLLLPSSGKSSALQMGGVNRANIDLFCGVLDIFGLDSFSFKKLDPEEIIAIKESDEFIAFKEMYIELVESLSDEENDIKDIVVKRMIRKQNTEKIKKIAFIPLNKINYLSGAIFLTVVGEYFLTSGQSDLVPKLLFSTGTYGVSQIINRLKFVQDGLNKHPVSDFHKYIINQNYKLEMLKNLRI